MDNFKYHWNKIDPQAFSDTVWYVPPECYHIKLTEAGVLTLQLRNREDLAGFSEDFSNRCGFILESDEFAVPEDKPKSMFMCNSEILRSHLKTRDDGKRYVEILLANPILFFLTPIDGVFFKI